ncbi:ketopantoate reductase family protein [Ammoniphilus resinae]|uniref:2-dehydropantoate 2-reductase n=1 Tax=Ammoniphilus resinae TaxID=861532 RepID=A0ABS4GK54_9BACL|nr:2-dehydropantoate 2-reductase [Ammoniphilus resinae]MBP1930645.1 2-dehydropantoate 2-reductase [Ammoniphilus resinae]
MKMNNIGIFGAGSIGLHLAAQLLLTGKNPTVICRTSKQADLLRQNGLSYTQLDGTEEKLIINAVTAQQCHLPLDYLFITVKQHHLADALPVLKELPVQANTCFIAFQNGLGHEEFLQQGFSQNPLFLAVTTEGAYREQLDRIRHTGNGTTWIGPSKSMKGEKWKESYPLVDLFTGSQLDVRLEDQIAERIWKKLIINSCINPLTGILRVKNGWLLESQYTLNVMESLFEEAAKVAEKEGIEIERRFLQEIVMVCRNTYHNKSSMLQDLEAGRSTEIDYINGAIKKIAEKHRINVPYHTMMIQLVQARQQMEKF